MRPPFWPFTLKWWRWAQDVQTSPDDVERQIRRFLAAVLIVGSISIPATAVITVWIGG